MVNYSKLMIRKYSTSEVSEYLGISSESVRRKCKNGELKGAYRKTGKKRSHWIIPEDAIREYERKKTK